MHVAHITIEDVCSGLFRTQVLNISREIVRGDPRITIDIHAINRPWMNDEHRRQLAKYAKMLEGGGVRIVYTPVLPPLRHALKSVTYSRGVTALLTAVLRFRTGRGVDVFHSRSYWPAMALRRLGHRNILFDPRSLWVAENLSTGDLVPDSASHRYWLAEEAACARESAVTTAISAGMAEHFVDQYQAKDVRLVPISFARDVFKFSADGRARHRAQLGWTDEKVFVYSGSLGMSHINVAALERLFGLAMSVPGTKLLFLSGEAEAAIHALMKSVGADPDRYRIVRPRQDEMGDWLSVGDVGLHALSRQHDYRTRLGTKVVEYWGGGMPTIVNENVGAAADYIRADDVGRVVNDATTTLEFAGLVSECLRLDRASVESFATRTFSSEVVAGLYRDAYAYVVARRPV